ncbi:hypothetical protein BH23CYA1_BH23CYA1_14980 [soil metagenome]|uniref:VOC family protein n=1 Tax=Leptolyngbya sp. BC1307 TaxID=2029589 RepID=UPI000EFAE8BC|nr:VOC family protein [Leptolyngbya sp. BC1307]
MNLNQVTLPSTDIRRSVAFCRGMGFRLIVESEDYARFECPAGESTFSVHKLVDIKPGSDTIIYFESDELDQLFLDLTNEGYAFEYAPRDEPWLWRETRLKDPDGNMICLFCAGVNRKHPPWRVIDA